MPDPCPECAKRPWLCFEHNEEQRTLELFDELWCARLAREQAYTLDLGKRAWYAGRSVAKGELLLTDAKADLKRRAWKVDETMPKAVIDDKGTMRPILETVLHYRAALALATEAFDRGYRSIARRR